MFVAVQPRRWVEAVTLPEKEYGCKPNMSEH